MVSLTQMFKSSNIDKAKNVFLFLLGFVIIYAIIQIDPVIELPSFFGFGGGFWVIDWLIDIQFYLLVALSVFIGGMFLMIVFNMGAWLYSSIRMFRKTMFQIKYYLDSM